MTLILMLAFTAIAASGCADRQQGSQTGGETEVSTDPSDPPETAETGGSAEEPAVSDQEAIDIVLERVPGSTKEEIVSFARVYDDGRWEYEGVLRHDGIEYEFEIDAQTGNLLEWELDD